MTNSTPAVVRFACAMTGFQAAPAPVTAMHLALDGLDAVTAMGTLDRETIICAVIAEIEDAAKRKNAIPLTARRDGDPTHREALTRAAEIFADEIWPTTFNGQDPTNKDRRIAISIYRTAFERAHQRRERGETVFPS